MASTNSIRRALLRPGHFLSLHSDRLLYVSPVRSLGGFSVLHELAAVGSTRRIANDQSRRSRVVDRPGGSGGSR